MTTNSPRCRRPAHFPFSPFFSLLKIIWSKGKKTNNLSKNQSKNRRANSEFQSYFTVINRRIFWLRCHTTQYHLSGLYVIFLSTWLLFSIFFGLRARSPCVSYFSASFFMLLSLTTTKCVWQKTNHGSSI